MRQLYSLFLILAACGDNAHTATPDGSTPDATVIVVDAPPDGPDVNPACLTPLALPVDANAKANAQAELATLAPTADMTWADARNTLQSVNGIVIQLPDCTGDTNAFDLLFTTLSAHPALFQIDPSEWTGNVARCKDIVANGFTPMSIYRTKYGPYPISHDVFSAVADVQGGTVILRNFSGFYLPPPPTAVLDAIAACPEISPQKLGHALFTTPFTYQAYEPTPAPACTIEGDHTYSEQTGDTVTYSDVAFDWVDDAPVTLQRHGVATVVVSSSHYSTQLLNSSANCFGDDGTPNVGWQRTYNAVTAELIGDRATPDPFCTVCLLSQP